MSAFLQFFMLVSNVVVQEQHGANSKSLNVVRCTSFNKDGIIKDECSFSPLSDLQFFVYIANGHLL